MDFNNIKKEMETIYQLSNYDNDGNFLSYNQEIQNHQDSLNNLKDFFSTNFNITDMETIHIILFSNGEEEIETFQEMENIIKEL